MSVSAMAIIGMIFGMAALYKVTKLEQALKEKGMIEDKTDSGK